jgi:hypothetical protein
MKTTSMPTTTTTMMMMTSNETKSLRYRAHERPALKITDITRKMTTRRTTRRRTMLVRSMLVAMIVEPTVSYLTLYY